MDVVRVVDVPGGMVADEAQRLLNVPCQENRYVLVQVFLLPNGDTRAFFRLASVAYDKKPGERGGFPGLLLPWNQRGLPDPVRTVF